MRDPRLSEWCPTKTRPKHLIIVDVYGDTEGVADKFLEGKGCKWEKLKIPGSVLLACLNIYWIWRQAPHLRPHQTTRPGMDEGIRQLPVGLWLQVRSQASHGPQSSS